MTKLQQLNIELLTVDGEGNPVPRSEGPVTIEFSEMHVRIVFGEGDESPDAYLERRADGFDIELHPDSGDPWMGIQQRNDGIRVFDGVGNRELAHVVDDGFDAFLNDQCDQRASRIIEGVMNADLPQAAASTQAQLNSTHCTLKSRGDVQNELTVRIEADEDSVRIHPNGYGTSDMADRSGPPVLLELLDSDLRVVVWPDINCSDAQIISLDKARNSDREALHATAERESQILVFMENEAFGREFFPQGSLPEAMSCVARLCAEVEKCDDGTERTIGILMNPELRG